MKLNDIKLPGCKKFSGYKPCISYTNCLINGCQFENEETKTGEKILIISLDALGNVLLNTSILKAIKRRHPISTVYWITQKSAKDILAYNPYIDHIYTWEDEQRMILRNIEFDHVFNGDKSTYACAFANEVKAKNKYGFALNSDGKIVPVNESAVYNYMLGIDDQLKFRENKKSGSQIIHETFELDFMRDDYVFNFTEEEIKFTNDFKSQVFYDPNIFHIGFNTGCSNLFPNKKMSVEQHVELIRRLLPNKYMRIVLLGGKEDTERNLEIYESFDYQAQREIIYTPTNLGIRSGACFMNMCDVVVTGDSFGMHLAIALKKYVIAWFGLSCASEIDLYDRGEKLVPEGLECSPCWKRECPFNLECISMVDLNKIENLIKRYCLIKPFMNSIN